tara:strand:+ start:541 stop:747 length:207 start_codon:yes stop_codon:yes gene_type:complete
MNFSSSADQKPIDAVLSEIRSLNNTCYQMKIEIQYIKSNIILMKSMLKEQGDKYLVAETAPISGGWFS